MRSNSFGLLPQITIFGQSHDPEIGVVLDGLPAGIKLDHARIDELLERRRPGKGMTVTARKESDAPRIDSGLQNGVTNGEPMRVTFANDDRRSDDYEQFKTIPRPSHADYLASSKYGEAHDIAGGGRFSGRLTLPLTFAGAVCLQILSQHGIEVHARLVEVEGERGDLDTRIEQARAVGDSVGGLIEVIADGLSSGIGEHPYGGVEPVLAQILFAIPGVRGVEFGEGFAAAKMRGSQHNDAWIVDDGTVKTETNHAGGVVAGMSTGMPLIVRIAFKPTASIAQAQLTANIETGRQEMLQITGRHDPCIAVRAVPVVEAAVAIGLLNLINLDTLSRSDGLEALRAQIDTIDDELLVLLEKRMRLTDEVGTIKTSSDIAIADPARQTAILERLSGKAQSENAPLINDLYQTIFAHSKKRQEPR